MSEFAVEINGETVWKAEDSHDIFGVSVSSEQGEAAYVNAEDMNKISIRIDYNDHHNLRLSTVERLKREENRKRREEAENTKVGEFVSVPSDAGGNEPDETAATPQEKILSNTTDAETSQDVADSLEKQNENDNTSAPSNTSEANESNEGEATPKAEGNFNLDTGKK